MPFARYSVPRGTPVMYHSAYPDEYLEELADRINVYAHSGQQVWCVFDNTASGAAMPNALSLLQRLGIRRNSE